MSGTTTIKQPTFTRYQVFIITILAILQFTVMVDFMILSPLGAILMPTLHITPKQFGLVVSAYAFSAGISGLLAAGFADKFDRKKWLMFFYTGFMIGTLLCAVAPTYGLLLGARVITGIFGGVVGSIGFAIITDLFKMETRGRVMGFVQMAFGASQVLGLPAGLYLSSHLGWHAPFWMIVGAGTIAGIVMAIYMKPITGHLAIKHDRNPFEHLVKTVAQGPYQRAFLTTVVMATGGFMIMPFATAFATNNMGLTYEQVTPIYFVTGISAFIFGPLAGKLSDKYGKLSVFIFGSLLSMIMVLIYTNLGITPLWMAITINVLLFAGITSRMIPAMALMTAIPTPMDRGAFMSINSSVQMISGGFAAFIAGLIVVQPEHGKLEHYDTLGIIVLCTMLTGIGMMYMLNKYVKKKMSQQPPSTAQAVKEEILITE